MMNSDWCKAGRLLSASVLAVGLISAGVAAQAKPTSTVVAASSTKTAAVDSSNAKAKRMKHLKKINRQERRVEFKHLGTSQ